MGGLKSDKKFVLDRMAHIPGEEKNRVSLEYEKIYLSGSKNFRKKANEFLHNEAVKYRDLK